MNEKNLGFTNRLRLPAEHQPFFWKWVGLHAGAMLAAYVIVQEVLHIRWFEEGGALLLFIYVLVIGVGQWTLLQSELKKHGLEYPVGTEKSFYDKIVKYEDASLGITLIWLLLLVIISPTSWYLFPVALLCLPSTVRSLFFKIPKEMSPFLLRLFGYVLIFGCGFVVLEVIAVGVFTFLLAMAGGELYMFNPLSALIYALISGVVGGRQMADVLRDLPEGTYALEKKERRTGLVWVVLWVLWLGYGGWVNYRIADQPCAWLGRLKGEERCLAFYSRDIAIENETISKSGKWMAYLLGNKIQIMDLESGKVINQLSTQEYALSGRVVSDFSPDESWLVIPRGTELIWWNFITNQASTIEFPVFKGNIQFTEDGKYLIAIYESLYEVLEVEKLESITSGRANCLANTDKWRMKGENLIEAYSDSGLICQVNWVSGQAVEFSAVMNENDVYEKYMSDMGGGLNAEYEELILGQTRDGVWLIIGNTIKELDIEEIDSDDWEFTRQRSRVYEFPEGTTLENLADFPLVGPYEINVVSFGAISNDGHYAAVIYLDTVWVFDTLNGSLIREIKFCKDEFCNVNPRRTNYVYWKNGFLTVYGSDYIQILDVLGEN